jgi:hypothetical protein
MRNLAAMAVLGAVVAGAPSPLPADPGKVALFPDLQSSLDAEAAVPPARYLLRPGDGALVLEDPLFDVRVEPDGTLTIRDLSPQSARLRRLSKQRYRRDEPPAPARPWGVSPPVYDERGKRARIRDVLPLVPLRADDPTRNPVNDLLLYRPFTPPWMWVEVFVPKAQHREVRDATLDLRIELARQAAERRTELALRRLPAQLDDIWRDDGVTEAQRRATIQALADEADTSTAAGKQAKAIIDAFLARRPAR